MRMCFRKGPLFYLFFNLRLFWNLLWVPNPALFIANDLDTLPGVYLASVLRRVSLLYDSHELFTEVPELVERYRVRKIWLGLESRLLPKLKEAITVSAPIAWSYQEKYGTPFRVVRNLPLSWDAKAKQEVKAMQKASGERIIAYQGALNKGRGLELMIDAMVLLDQWKLVIIGTGDVEAELKSRVASLGMQGRVEFTGRLAPEALRHLTATASLGISLEEDLGLSYRYALPNKLFDYIQAGIPVLCADLPEMRRVVEENGIGMVLEERTAQALAQRVEELYHASREGSYAKSLETAARTLNWENESGIYLDVVERLTMNN